MVTIYEININPDKLKVLLYSEKNNHFSGVFNQTIIDVSVNKKDSVSFFRKIEEMYQETPDSSWREVKIKAQVYGWDMAGNGWCKKSYGLIGYSIEEKE